MRRRLLFRAVASREEGFVRFVYAISVPLVAPFRPIVSDQPVGRDTGRVLEISSLIAMLLWFLAAYLLVTLIAIGFDQDGTPSRGIVNRRALPRRRSDYRITPMLTGAARGYFRGVPFPEAWIVGNPGVYAPTTTGEKPPIAGRISVVNAPFCCAGFRLNALPDQR